MLFKSSKFCSDFVIGETVVAIKAVEKHFSQVTETIERNRRTEKLMLEECRKLESP